MVHDLSQLTADEAEALLRDPRGHCVRAEVTGDGSVRLKSRPGQNHRRMLIAVGASIGLFASACETVRRPVAQTGVIRGNIDRFSFVQSVTAISESGKRYRAKVRRDGTYRFRPLPLGSYSLQFVGLCDTVAGGTVAPQAGENIVATASHTDNCIIVGLARVEENIG